MESQRAHHNENFQKETAKYSEHSSKTHGKKEILEDLQLKSAPATPTGSQKSSEVIGSSTSVTNSHTTEAKKINNK